MVLQKQYNLRRWNSAMTDCISLAQLVRFLNQAIYKLRLAMETPFATTPFFLSCARNKWPPLSPGISLSAAVKV